MRYNNRYSKKFNVSEHNKGANVFHEQKPPEHDSKSRKVREEKRVERSRLTPGDDKYINH